MPTPSCPGPSAHCCPLAELFTPPCTGTPPHPASLPRTKQSPMNPTTASSVPHSDILPMLLRLSSLSPRRLCSKCGVILSLGALPFSYMCIHVSMGMGVYVLIHASEGLIILCHSSTLSNAAGCLTQTQSTQLCYLLSLSALESLSPPSEDWNCR